MHNRQFYAYWKIKYSFIFYVSTFNYILLNYSSLNIKLICEKMITRILPWFSASLFVCFSFRRKAFIIDLVFTVGI